MNWLVSEAKVGSRSTRRTRRSTLRLAILTSVSLLFVASSQQDASAQTVRLDRQTVAAMAGAIESVGYRQSVTVGQLSPVGGMSHCNVSYWASAGFWTIVSDAPVPIALRVFKTPGLPGFLTLQWTGTASMFDIYRDTGPTSIGRPENLWLTLPVCETTQPQGTQSIYYFDVEEH